MATTDTEQDTKSKRLLWAVLAFLVVAGLVYGSAWVALALLRHVIMPIVAIAAGGYVAATIYRSGATLKRK